MPARFHSEQGEARRTHLTHLAAELHRLGAPALIALSSTDHPVLYTVRDRRRVAVLAVEHGGTWWFIWGKEGQMSVERPDLAARFLCGAEATVTSLFARRPRPRDGGAHHHQYAQPTQSTGHTHLAEVA